MVQINCEICQIEFTAPTRNTKYCGKDCYKEARRRQSHTPEGRARGLKKARRRYDRNPEHVRAINRKSQAKHKEQRAKDTREWLDRNPDYLKQQSRKWRAEHPDLKSADGKRYYEANKEKVAARIRKRLQENPIILQEKNSRRRALRAQALGRWTPAQFKELCEAVDYHCAYCLQRFDKLSADHITPLFRGGSNDIENIIPACVSCNSAKGAKTPLEFLRSSS